MAKGPSVRRDSAVKKFLLWMGGVLAVVGTAFQLAGVAILLLANVSLFVGVCVLTIAEVWYSEWFKRTRLYGPAVICSVAAVSLCACVMVSATIYHYKYGDHTVRLSVGESEDRTDPLETRFILTNIESRSIQNVQYVCVAFFDSHRFAVGVDTTNISSLESGHQYSLYCDMGGRRHLFQQQMVILHLWVSHNHTEVRESLPRERQGFEMFAKRDLAGKYHWFPAGSVDPKSIDVGVDLREGEDK